MHDGAAAVEDRAASREQPVDDVDILAGHAGRSNAKAFVPPAKLAKQIRTGRKIRAASDSPRNRASRKEPRISRHPERQCAHVARRIARRRQDRPRHGVGDGRPTKSLDTRLNPAGIGKAIIVGDRKDVPLGDR